MHGSYRKILSVFRGSIGTGCTYRTKQRFETNYLTGNTCKRKLRTWPRKDFWNQRHYIDRRNQADNLHSVKLSQIYWLFTSAMFKRSETPWHHEGGVGGGRWIGLALLNDIIESPWLWIFADWRILKTQWISRVSAVIFDTDTVLWLSYVRILGPRRNLDHRSDLSLALVRMLISSSLFFFRNKFI